MHKNKKIKKNYKNKLKILNSKFNNKKMKLRI